MSLKVGKVYHPHWKQETCVTQIKEKGKNMKKLTHSHQHQHHHQHLHNPHQKSNFRLMDILEYLRAFFFSFSSKSTVPKCYVNLGGKHPKKHFPKKEKNQTSIFAWTSITAKNTNARWRIIASITANRS
jgi:hypothetical protein